MTGLIIVLPWIALSWFCTQFAQSTAPQLPVNDLDATVSNEYLVGIASKACALTAGTLILLGCGQIIRKSQQHGGSELSEGALPAFTGSIVSAAFFQVCSIGLPIYAGLKIGGFFIALALSLVLASGAPTISPGNARGRLGQKKLTVVLLAVVVLLGYFGLNAALDESPLMGYVALLAAVFVIRPPFAVDHPRSTAEIGLGLSATRDSISEKKLSDPGLASNDSSNNAVLDILSGLVLALVTLVASGSPSVNGIHVISFGLTAGSFAISLLFSSPSDLQSPQKFGHAAATGAAALFCSAPSQEDIWVPYVARSTLAAISFFAARFDDRHLRLGAHSHNRNHHHHHSHTHSNPSKVSNMILHLCEPYPLLYSILKESDSRRIFYFMTYVLLFLLENLSLIKSQVEFRLHDCPAVLWLLDRVFGAP